MARLDKQTLLLWQPLLQTNDQANAQNNFWLLVEKKSSALWSLPVSRSLRVKPSSRQHARAEKNSSAISMRLECGSLSSTTLNNTMVPWTNFVCLHLRCCTEVGSRPQCNELAKQNEKAVTGCLDGNIMYPVHCTQAPEKNSGQILEIWEPGNPDSWNPKIIKNENSQNPNTCRAKCRQGLD